MTAQGLRDLSQVCDDIDGHLFASGAIARLDDAVLASLPPVPDGSRLGPCVASVGKIVCVGLNYREHARESGAPIPDEPILFMKATSAISGPFDDIVLPRGSVKTDWEVELGVVIGARASYVDEYSALSCIAGYCVINDLSEREYQLERGGQWDKGKGCDTFAPIGPWLVTADEVPDPQALELYLYVDDVQFQRGHTSDMIFPVSKLVAYISRFMTLHPGDIIATGTPPGVGLGQVPPHYLRAGNVVRLGISGLGEQRQTVVAQEASAGDEPAVTPSA